MAIRPDKFTDRLFFALRPDAATIARIEAARDRLRAEQGMLGQPLDAADLQITLYHLGDFVRFPQELADKAIAAAASVSAPAFEFMLDQATSFKRRTVKHQPCVLLAGGEGLEALKAFHGQLAAALKVADPVPLCHLHAARHLAQRRDCRRAAGDRADQLDRERVRADEQPARQVRAGRAGPLALAEEVGLLAAAWSGPYSFSWANAACRPATPPSRWSLMKTCGIERTEGPHFS